jgi:ubiquinone/menaquinone biosynthesis C-methylase UbiE
VLEIATGTGQNLRYYQPGVRLTAVELSPSMVAIARQEADALGREVDLRVGDAQALEFPDASFDTVVCTLGLCTIPDDPAAVREAKRVLRPGGRFVLREHVRSPQRVVRIAERMLEPIMLRFEHDHLTREPLDHLTAEGFAIERVSAQSSASSSGWQRARQPRRNASRSGQHRADVLGGRDRGCRSRVAGGTSPANRQSRDRY